VKYKSRYSGEQIDAFLEKASKMGVEIDHIKNNTPIIDTGVTLNNTGSLNGAIKLYKKDGTEATDARDVYSGVLKFKSLFPIVPFTQDIMILQNIMEDGVIEYKEVHQIVFMGANIYKRTVRVDCGDFDANEERTYPITQENYDDKNYNMGFYSVLWNDDLLGGHVVSPDKDGKTISIGNLESGVYVLQGTFDFGGETLVLDRATACDVYRPSNDYYMMAYFEITPTGIVFTEKTCSYGEIYNSTYKLNEIASSAIAIALEEGGKIKTAIEDEIQNLNMEQICTQQELILEQSIANDPNWDGFDAWVVFPDKVIEFKDGDAITIILNENGQEYSIDIPISIDKKGHVYWDADKYGHIEGCNWSFAPSYDENGFVLLVLVQDISRVDPYTSIRVYKSIVVKLDEKFIPDTIARVSDLDNKIGAPYIVSPDAEGNTIRINELKSGTYILEGTFDFGKETLKFDKSTKADFHRFNEFSCEVTYLEVDPVEVNIVSKYYDSRKDENDERIVSLDTVECSENKVVAPESESLHSDVKYPSMAIMSYYLNNAIGAPYIVSPDNKGNTIAIRDLESGTYILKGTFNLGTEEIVFERATSCELYMDGVDKESPHYGHYSLCYLEPPKLDGDDWGANVCFIEYVFVDGMEEPNCFIERQSLWGRQTIKNMITKYSEYDGTNRSHRYPSMGAMIDCVDSKIGDVNAALENIITKYGLGGDSE
jgi:hypothetical protein